MAGCAVLLLLPGVLLGVWIAERARARNLAASWALVVAVPALGLLAYAAHAASRAATAESVALAALAPVALAGWVGVAPFAGAFWHVRRDRRDRLRGGSAGRAVDRRVGPLQLMRRRLARGRDGHAAQRGAAVCLGRDDLGFDARVPLLRAHATIVGGSDTGKTNTASVLLEDHVASGFGAVVLDGKGGRDLPQVAVTLARRHERHVAIWSVEPLGVESLDRARHAWNPVGEGNATEIKDRIAASEDQTEPYYAAIASRGLLNAATALLAIDGRVWLDTLADVLEDPATLIQALELAAVDSVEHETAWLASLNDGERSALRGMATRLRTMVRSQGGAWLAASGRQELSLYQALREGWLVVFSLPQGTYPELVPHVARYAISALNAACTRMEREGAPARSLLLVDELSAFRGDALTATYERARSAGVRVIAATQSLSNFAAAGGEKLLHAALDNSELIIVHRQTVPDATELLGGLAGTEEAWEYSQQITAHQTGRLAELIGSSATDQHGRRLNERFRAHPNVIRQLARGEAVVVSHRPQHAVRHVRVRAGLTASPSAIPAGPDEHHPDGASDEGGTRWPS